MAKTKKKAKAKATKNTCNPSEKLWCVSIMTVAIIVLTWVPTFTETWSRVVVTIMAALMFTRSMAFNCCK